MSTARSAARGAAASKPQSHAGLGLPLIAAAPTHRSVELAERVGSALHLQNQAVQLAAAARGAVRRRRWRAGHWGGRGRWERRGGGGGGGRGRGAGLCCLCLRGRGRCGGLSPAVCLLGWLQRGRWRGCCSCCLFGRLLAGLLVGVVALGLIPARGLVGGLVCVERCTRPLLHQQQQGQRGERPQAGAPPARRHAAGLPRLGRREGVRKPRRHPATRRGAAWSGLAARLGCPGQATQRVSPSSNQPLRQPASHRRRRRERQRIGAGLIALRRAGCSPGDAVSRPQEGGGSRCRVAGRAI